MTFARKPVSVQLPSPRWAKNGYVTTEILDKICTALDCRVEDIMEISVEEECE